MPDDSGSQLDAIKTDKFEITVTKVGTRDSVGTEYFEKKPASGGVYVTVQWQYKNISDKPVGSLNVPRINVEDTFGCNTLLL